MTVNVDPSPEPTFSPIVPTDVCEGATILLPDSSNDTPPITGSWSTPTVDPITTIDTSIVRTEFYTFTPDGLQCATAPDSIQITVNPSNTLINVDATVTDAFTDNQIITVIATATGNYLYQLDSGPLQTSPIFENVFAGTHTITVSDAKGCSDFITKSDILVIKHPKYFTPNGDGFNDTWKLSGLSSILITKIYIFDRYGKLLKEIAASGSGWDGTYLGVPMPADDYWFTVDYVEGFLSKQFKSHFSLKR
jgi:gliding motility-associated-like protein